MPKRFRTKLTKHEFDYGIIPYNHVLVEMTHSAEGAKSKGGVIVGFNVDDTYENDDSHVGDLAEVYGVVRRLPRGLYFNPEDQNSMPWETEMELCEDDIVYFNILESKNAVEIEYEGKVYRIIPYQDCYVAKRRMKWSKSFKRQSIELADIDATFICLNGFVLCEPVYKEALSSLDSISEDQFDMTKGIVRYFGTPNKAYVRKEHADFLDLSEGDVVVFEAKTPLFFLERKSYLATLDGDKRFWVVQRRRIAYNLKH